ncbi:MAG: hypothetical protein DRP74_07875 [Candidatus Omnitrophota bacterium]|nr:MAG: hypothetical protein DRP74_07875 [Candidatus Omnitrophota bacterium]
MERVIGSLGYLSSNRLSLWWSYAFNWNSIGGGINESHPSQRSEGEPHPHYWFYIYLLRSKSNGSIYIGCTSSLRKRFQEHEEGKN